MATSEHRPQQATLLQLGEALPVLGSAWPAPPESKKGVNVMAIQNNDDVISTLNNLIETCKDGEDGFRSAAEGVQNSKLKSLFTGYAQQRAQFASELQKEVRQLGGDPEKAGSTAASLHRGWMGIKSAVMGKDDGAIISECERGEDSAVKNYEEALRENLPPEIHNAIEEQFAAIKQAHDQVRALEQTRAAGT